MRSNVALSLSLRLSETKLFSFSSSILVVFLFLWFTETVIMLTSFFFLPVLFIAGLIVCYIAPSKFLSWVSSLLPVAASRKSVVAPARAPTTKRSHIDKVELEMVFATFDKNGDGSITKRELQESLENLGLFVTKDQISAMVEKFDSNRDGLIDFEEFCALYESMAKREEAGGEGEGDDLKEAFDVFDENGDGLITAEELGLVMASLGLNRGAEDCKNMIQKVDKDGDGKVNFEEFKLMMQSKTTTF